MPMPEDYGEYKSVLGQRIAEVKEALQDPRYERALLELGPAAVILAGIEPPSPRKGKMSPETEAQLELIYREAEVIAAVEPQFDTAYSFYVQQIRFLQESREDSEKALRVVNETKAKSLFTTWLNATDPTNLEIARYTNTDLPNDKQLALVMLPGTLGDTQVDRLQLFDATRAEYNALERYYEVATPPTPDAGTSKVKAPQLLFFLQLVDIP